MAPGKELSKEEKTMIVKLHNYFTSEKHDLKGQVKPSKENSSGGDGGDSNSKVVVI